jgi:hypothetical protein
MPYLDKTGSNDMIFTINNNGMNSIVVIHNLITESSSKIRESDEEIYPHLNKTYLVSNSVSYAILGRNDVEFNTYRGNAISVFDLDSNDYPDIMLTTVSSNKRSTSIYLNEKGTLQNVLPLNDSSILYAFPFDLYEDGYYDQ